MLVVNSVGSCVLLSKSKQYQIKLNISRKFLAFLLILFKTKYWLNSQKVSQYVQLS